MADERRVGAPKIHEQRSNPRYEVDLAVGVTVEDVSVPGRVVNLSFGGALIRVGVPGGVRVGQRLAVSFVVPAPGGAISLRAACEVRWLSQRDGESMGVQFTTGFRPREVYALGQYFKSLD